MSGIGAFGSLPSDLDAQYDEFLARNPATDQLEDISAVTTVYSVIDATFWLMFVCPHAASATATIACPRCCCCWLLTQLALLLRPQTAAP